MIDTNGSDVSRSDKPRVDKVFLNNEDLMELNYNTETLRGFKKDETIVQLKMEILKVQEALLDAQKETIKRDRMLIEYQAGLNREKEVIAKDNSRVTLDVITSNYAALVGKKWGYNPNDGEIIINEE